MNKQTNIVFPRSELELKIQEIFADILGIEQKKLSIKDDFFELACCGSIDGIQLVNKLKETLGYTISIKDIFKYRTIEFLYDNVIIKL
jgi:acyl carrier protein